MFLFFVNKKKNTLQTKNKQTNKKLLSKNKKIKLKKKKKHTTPPTHHRHHHHHHSFLFIYSRSLAGMMTSSIFRIILHTCVARTSCCFLPISVSNTPCSLMSLVPTPLQSTPR